MTGEIIAVGTELLLGEILNTNASFLASQLAEIGITTHFQTVVGDNKDRIISALSTALKRSDVIIFTGGLGPTADDMTKETVCEALGKEIVLFEDQFEIMKKKFGHINCTMTSNNTKQAMFPRDANILENPNGTAPGCMLKGGKQLIFMLPGPPFEMEPMFRESVKPILQKQSDRVIRSKRMEFFGIGESNIETKLADLMEGENPTVAPYAKMGQVSIRVTSGAQSEQECDEKNNNMIQKIKDRVGEYLYGYDSISMEQVVVNAMRDQKLTISAVEAFTGGVIADRFTECSGHGDVFHGGMIITSAENAIDVLGIEEKVIHKNGFSSPATASQLAIQGARIMNTDLCISSIGDEENGVSYIGIYGFGQIYVKELDVQSHRRSTIRMKSLTALHGFDLIRRFIDDGLREDLGMSCVFPEEIGTKGENNLKISAYDPNRPKRGKKFGLTMIIVSLLALCILAGYFVLGYFKNRQNDTQPVDNPQPVSSSQPISKVNSEYMEKIGAAHEKNKDVAGYLTCGEISTPVVRRDDNSYYLTHSVDGGAGAAPYFETGENGKNNVIYSPGGAGKPFDFLGKYADINYYKSNPTITFGDMENDSVYKIVSVFYGCTNDEHGKNFPYWSYIGSDKKDVRDAYAKEIVMRSIISTGVDVVGDDSFVTLHTNNDMFFGGRFVVVARRLRDAEPKEVDTSGAKMSQTALMPASWYVVRGQEINKTVGPYTEKTM